MRAIASAPGQAAPGPTAWEQAASITRGQLLRRAFAGIGVALAAPVDAALAQSGGDVAIVRFALTLERIELAFYEHAAGLELSGELADLVREFGAHQRVFAEALTRTVADLGGRPDPAPRVTFASTEEASFLLEAVAVEDLGVAAFNGAGPRLVSKELLAVAGSIVSTEAAHATTWRVIAGESATVAAFDESFSRGRVLSGLAPFLAG